MRLIELRLKNLNSLKGEWHINFADSAFIDEGIFAITGQTGAGKTTILDAICLALYSYTPRLGKITGAYNEIMTQGTGECFAEVVIEVNSKKYRCSWYQHRAHKKAKGNLLPIKHEISDVDTGKILEDGKSKTAPYIQNLLGMDFDQFTRSIMLAQGSFAAFLKSDSDKRGAILEKITGTSIYGTISLGVHEKHRIEKEILSKLQYGLDGLALLDVDEENQLQHELQSHQDSHRTQQQSIEDLAKKIQWLDSVTASKEKMCVYQHDLEQAQKAEQDFIPDAKRLTAASQALEIDSQFINLTNARTQHQQMQTDAKQLDELLPKQQTAVEQAKGYLDKAITNVHIADDALQTALPTIKKARDLDIDIAQQDHILREMQRHHDTLTTEITDAKTALDEKLQYRSSKQANLDKLTKQLASTAHLVQLDGDIANFDSDCRRLKDVIQQNAALSQDQMRKTRELEEDKIALAAQQQRQQAHDDKNKAAQERLTALQTAQSDLMQTQSITQMRAVQTQIDSTSQQLEKLGFHDQQRRVLNVQITQIARRIEQLSSEISGYDDILISKKATLQNTQEKRQDKANQLQLQQKVAALESHIANLQEGHPCPLCGALEHPYSEQHPHLVPDSDSAELAESIRTLDKVIAELNDSITAQQIEQASKRSTLESKNSQHTELTTRIQQHDTAITELLHVVSQQMENKDTADSMITTLLKPLLALGSDDDLESALTDSIDKLNQYRADITDTLERYDSYAEELARVRETLEAAAQDQQTLASDISEQKSKITISENTISTIHGQLAANFVELKTLITGILQCIATYAASNYPTEALSTLQRAPEYLQPLADSIEQQSVLSNAEYDHHLEALREQRRALLQLKGTFTEDKDQQQALQTDLASIKTQIQSQEKNLDKDIAKIRQLIQTLDKQKDALTQLQSARAQLFAATDLDAAEQSLRDTLEQAKTDHATAQRQLDNETYNLQQLIQQQETLAERIKDAAQTLEIQQNTFQDALAGSDFSDEAAFLAARLPFDERSRLKTIQSRIDNTLQQAQSAVASLESELNNLQSAPPTTDDRETLVQQQQQAQEDSNARVEAIGAISQQLRDNKEKKHTQQAQIDAINTQKDKLQVWQQLHKLIGSADGKKYRTFAQGLTFDLMITHANTQLQKMSDRYLLARDDDSPLELNVIDNYQGGEIRSTKNLSGGEGFIISLALALGLSQMASQNIRVDSLFLDEGFGTLDEESLDIALDTLTNLQQEGKLIGVISHVQALKDRILTQIKVEKLSGGFSRISGQGCHKVVSEKAS
ncbi:AAA family ATPase [Psychrobacter sp. Ps6]|uniref:AAA family ATPase n=1 Tax=Psychrobacter sp. Ps6 TaxID=2790960 RepID=UPI001EDF4482|nr:AAA family ATPase [Psychrobacter sp. Ps6]MCG3879340.1 AAA family ATPase [Psychrobacter sp. Ps6]